ncbi:hypothetical protein [Pseudomonas sp. zfem002]|uniref:hypothetical protein n=1 Tax=Pseudomonas sp. zfem002 TaxID=3078197 RepID=UPI00292991D4|nr:hypothetical protein [Pseudomonas sp. zfem002]MDU9392165.1 hypothetical protein [Pseudomonas sp. zfem002]
MVELKYWHTMGIMFMGLGFVISFAIAFGHSAYIVKKHFTEILSSVKSSPALHSNLKTQALMGFSRKIYAIRELQSALSSPRLLSSEYLSLRDIEEFPPHLLKLLTIDNFLFNVMLLFFLGGISLIPIIP